MLQSSSCHRNADKHRPHFGYTSGTELTMFLSCSPKLASVAWAVLPRAFTLQCCWANPTAQQETSAFANISQVPVASSW